MYGTQRQDKTALLIPDEIFISPKILNEMFETCYKQLLPLSLMNESAANSEGTLWDSGRP